MKTILGQRIVSYQFYKMDDWATGRKKMVTKGFIWLEDGNSIRISGNKFTIIMKDRKITGFISNRTNAYRKIKRMIARWFQLYRKHGIFNFGTDAIRNKITKRIFLIPA